MAFNNTKAMVKSLLSGMSTKVHRMEAEFDQSDWLTMLEDLRTVEGLTTALFDDVSYLNSYDTGELEGGNG